jgi:rRNA processing protein Krr1/Pno1
MAKFGLFDGKLKEPHQEFEGDHLIISGETVSVMGKDDEGNQRTVAVIRLAQGQSVKKV